MTPIFSHMVTRTILLTVFLLWPPFLGMARAGQLTVPADGRIVTSDTLVEGRLYRIIVDGTVSAGSSATCANIDALWAYTIPKGEEQRGHMPAAGDIYLGSDTIRRWKVGELLYSFQASTQLGLRINGRPLPHRFLEPERHRYMVEMVGTGAPISLQFLDREHAGAQPTDSLIDAYADNCGAFLVRIEDAHPLLQTVCDVEVRRRGPDGRVVRLRVPRALSQSTLSVNGTVTRVDSVICPPLPPSASTFFLLDRSGSISQRDTEVGGVRVQRSEVTDIALRRALFALQQQDTVAIASFDARMRPPSVWASPPRLLADSLDDVPRGATNLYGGLSEMAAYVRSSKGSANVVLFTDGGNRFPEFDPSTIVRALNGIGGNVGIVLLPDETPEVTTANRLAIESNLQGVHHLRIRQVGSVLATDRALGLILDDIDLSSCCTLVFTLPLCTSTSLSEFTIIQLDTFTTALSIPCSPSLNMDGDVAVRVVPTPSDDRATVEITSLVSATMTVHVVDLAGKVLESIKTFVQDPGTKTLTFDTRFWANGVYAVHVVANDLVIAARLLVLH